MPVSELYVEGKTDLAVFQQAIGQLPSNPPVQRKGTKDDLHHLVRRERQDNPASTVVYLRDRDFDFEPVFPTPSEPTELLHGGAVHGYRWQRHEIENYLLTPALVEAVFGVPVADTEAALLAAAAPIRDYQAARWTIGQTRSLSRVGSLQTRPVGLGEFGLPADLSAAAVETWATSSIGGKLAAYTAAMDPAVVQTRFSDYQIKFASLSATEVLIWFSGKDLLTAMIEWRNLPRVRSPHPENFVSKIIRWLNEGNGLRFFDLVPEAKALADKLIA